MTRKDNKYTRGCIIIDACSLFVLTNELPPDFLDAEANQSAALHLWKIIPFLAENGYEIIIPEMVALEAAQILHDGRGPSAYFYSRKQGAALLKKLLNEGRRENYLTIAPPPLQDTSPAQKYISCLWAILKSNQSDNGKRGQIMSLHTDIDICDYGEMAARELIRYMDARVPRIFFLSEDGKALNEALAVRKDIPVHKLTCLNLLEALKDENLLTELSVNAAKTDSFPSLFTEHIAKTSSWGMQFGGAHTNTKNKRIFSDTLGGIREKIGTDREVSFVVTADEVPMPRSDRIAKFHERFGKKGQEDRLRR